MYIVGITRTSSQSTAQPCRSAGLPDFNFDNLFSQIMAFTQSGLSYRVVLADERAKAIVEGETVPGEASQPGLSQDDSPKEQTVEDADLVPHAEPTVVEEPAAGAVGSGKVFPSAVQTEPAPIGNECQGGSEELEEQVFVTPRAAGSQLRANLGSKERTPSPSRDERDSFYVTPLSPKKPSLSSRSSKLVHGEGSDDETDRVIFVRTREGGEYSVLAASDGIAHIPDEVLAMNLMGEDWEGRMTVRKDNGLRDESRIPLDDGGFLWQLKPGSYVARGVPVMRFGKRSSSGADGGSRSQKGGSASLARSVSVAASGLQRRQTDSITKPGRVSEAGSWKSSIVGLGLLQKKKGVVDEDEVEEEVTSEGQFRKPTDKVMQEIENHNLEGAIKVRESVVAHSVLSANMHKDYVLKQMVEKWDKEGRSVQVVSHVPYPLDGDVIYVKDLNTSLLAKGEDKGCHWKDGRTLNKRLNNGETVRKFACAGGFECEYEDCPFVQEH